MNSVSLPLLGVAVGAVLLAAGCDTVSDADRLKLDLRAERAVYAYAAGNRDLRTEIVGNPFGAPDAAVAAAVTGAMTGADEGFNARFTPRPGADALTGYKVVVVFDPAAGTRPGVACANAESGAASAEGSAGARVRVWMIFCAPAGAHSGATATLPAAPRLDDPVVTGTFKALVGEMLPRERKPTYSAG